MRFGLNIILVLGALFILGGCAQLNTVTKKKHFEKHSQAVFIDAKQRAVFIQKRNGKERTAICAEPSPDALSVYAASGGVDITTKAGASGAAQFAAAEAGGSIGLRTQSIQLMRDAMYRICEGYAGGALDKASFETLHRRFQQSMVTILAVEQLTGAVRPPALVLAGGASSDSETIRNATSETRALRMEMNKRQEELDAKKAEIAQKKADSTKIDEAAKTHTNGAKTTEEADAQTVLSSDIAELTEQQKTAQKSYDDAREAYEAQNALRSDIIRRGGDVGSAGGLLSGASSSIISKEAAASVATAVQAIVADYNELSFIEEVCTTVFTSFIDGDLTEGKMKYVTEDVFFKYDPGSYANESLFELCVTQLGKGVKTFEAREAELKDQIVELKQSKKGLQADRTSYRNTISELRKTIERLSEEKTQKETINDALKEEIKENKLDLEFLEDIRKIANGPPEMTLNEVCASSARRARLNDSESNTEAKCKQKLKDAKILNNNAKAPTKN